MAQKPGIAIWITGLPGSGKSTLSEEVRASEPGIRILRMDELRRVATPEPTYSDAERDVLYRCLVFTAKTLTELGHDVIIDATGNLRRWRLLARSVIPGYAEVYLKCPLEVCQEREARRRKAHAAPGGIYEKAERGWPVPGVTAPYEEPREPEAEIDTASTPLGEQVRMVRKVLAGLRGGH